MLFLYFQRSPWSTLSSQTLAKKPEAETSDLGKLADDISVHLLLGAPEWRHDCARRVLYLKLFRLHHRGR